MRARELSGHKWASTITVTNPNYTGRITVSVFAHTQAEARQLIKAQYNIQDHHIGSIKRVS